MKLLRVFLLISFLILLFGTIAYYTYPSRIQNILPQFNKLEKIHVTYISEGKSVEYLLSEEQLNESDELINILNDVSYRKRFSSFNGSYGNVIMLDINYIDENGNKKYGFIDFRETGTFIFNHKVYQIYGNSEALFNKLFNWIQGEVKK